MIRELYKFMDKTFENGCEPPEEAIQLLVEGEEVMYSFETKAKDKALFTNKRLMVMDKGSRKKIYSIPYSEVVVWSSEECADVADKNAEVTLWTELEKVKVNLAKGADVRGIDRVIAQSKL